MRRDELLDALRRAYAITGDKDFVVVGSQAIHGAFNKAVLPKATMQSMETDILPLFDAEGDKFWALSVRGKSGPGAEIDGVDIGTSTLPEGWVDRLVPLPCDGSPDGVIGWCLDPHDLVVAKAIAGRPKDHRFIEAAAKANLVNPQVALRRMEKLDQGCNVPTEAEIEAARFYLASLPVPTWLFKPANRQVPKHRRRPRREDFPRPRDMFADLRDKGPHQVVLPAGATVDSALRAQRMSPLCGAQTTNGSPCRRRGRCPYHKSSH